MNGSRLKTFRNKPADYLLGAQSTEKATITPRGAILLGKHVACDAHDETKSLRVVTHAHADHMMGLQQSLRSCEKVLMTRQTRDLILAMMGPLALENGHIETPEFGKTIHLEEESLTFFHAEHILGSTQVLVDDVEGTRIAYTSDFKIGNTPVLQTDVLVMEATYGDPSCTRPFKNDVKAALVSLVEKGLKQGTVCIFGYHGKLQEVMRILRDGDIQAPFIAPERIRHISNVFERHGIYIGQLMPTDESTGKELLESNYPCIAFYHMNSRGKVGQDAFRISVSGWEFGLPQRQTGPNEYTVALSDHSDYNELIQYVRQSRPKHVITDSYRDGHAEALAREIRKELAIRATALPNSQHTEQHWTYGF